MKATLLAFSFLGLALVQNVAHADVYDCDGTACHEYVVTAEDLGEVDPLLCGPATIKPATDGKCHEYTYCGADLGESQGSCTSSSK